MGKAVIRNSYEASQAFGKKKKSACRLYFYVHKAKKLGLGDVKSPTSSCPCIYRAELALPYATYPEPMPT